MNKIDAISNKKIKIVKNTVGIVQEYAGVSWRTNCFINQYILKRIAMP